MLKSLVYFAAGSITTFVVLRKNNLVHEQELDALKTRLKAATDNA